MPLNETDPQLVARLISQGGRILVVGGETKDLPIKITNHPSIVIWDDNKQGFSNKIIPANIKIFVWNRWVSHSTVSSLNQAVIDRKALKFPFLRSKEIKELLSEVVNEPLIEKARLVSQEEIEVSNTIQEKQIEVTKEELMKKTNSKGWLKEYVAKNININLDYSGRSGNIKKEGQRLFDKAKNEGVKTTIQSITNMVGIAAREFKGDKPISNKVTTVKINTKSVTKTQDEFEGLDNLISDAITALKLVQEHMPKLRKEVSQLRIAKDKIRNLLG